MKEDQTLEVEMAILSVGCLVSSIVVFVSFWLVVSLVFVSQRL